VFDGRSGADEDASVRRNEKTSMKSRQVIRLAPCLSATLWFLASLPLAASDPSVYVACGVHAEGNPTLEQLLCIAEAIGVPKDPANRVVRHGFNATFAEPTVEILHHLERQVPHGGRAVLNMTLELSEVDGQLLYFGPAFETITDTSAVLEVDVPNQAIQSVQAPRSLASLCPAEQSSMTPDRLQCMARALGMGEGKRGLRIRTDGKGSLGEVVWTIENTLEDSPCQAYGTVLEVAVADARVLRYGLVQATCAHGPVPKRPILRTIRRQ